MTGNWKKEKEVKDDEEFGKGKLGVRHRKIDPAKAMDMNVDPYTSNHVKVRIGACRQRVAGLAVCPCVCCSVIVACCWSVGR